MKAGHKLIVGLGNPGADYKRTRHNAGAMAIQRLAKDLGFEFRFNRSFESFFATGEYAGEQIDLLLPQTFMNLSGRAVADAARKKHIASGDILIAYDDVALPLGEIRLKSSGSSGGHRGIESVIDLLGIKDFARIRLGIGGAEEDRDLSDYVLSKFNKKELGALSRMLENASDAIKVWAAEGIDVAMNRFNKKEKGKRGVVEA